MTHSLCASSMRKTGIFFAGGARTLPFSFASCRASPFTLPCCDCLRAAASAWERRLPKRRLRHDGLVPLVWSCAVRTDEASDSALRSAAQTASMSGWKVQ